MSADIFVREATRSEWPLGVAVVLAAQAATGLPDPIFLPPLELEARIRARQEAALSVWLARVGDTVVGHGLVQPVPPDHPDWSVCSTPGIAAALAEGRLVELGALAVHPGHTGRGAVSLLASTRLGWCRSRPELVVVCSVWTSSPGSVKLAQRHGRRLGAGCSGRDDLYVYQDGSSPIPGGDGGRGVLTARGG